MAKYFKSKDPFGDFDLIFSAAFAGDKILEYPVHYRARIYGETQISRFRDGFKLIKYFIESFYLLIFQSRQNGGSVGIEPTTLSLKGSCSAD